MASSLLPHSKTKQATYATFSEAATSPPRLELPEISAVPWLSRFTYTHARPLLDAGSIRRLELDDLWALEPRHHASTFYAAFQRARTAGSSPTSVQHALLHCVGPKLLLCGLGTGVRAACALFAPVVLRRVIDAFSAAPDVDMDSILSWVGAFFASRLLNAFLEAHVNFAMEMTLMEMTVSLKAVVMEKILQRDRVVSCKETQQSIHVANVVTADIDNLMWASYSLNAAWILPLQIAGVVYLLYDVLDLAAFAGLAVVVLSMALNNVVATRMKRVFDDLMQLKDGRMQIVKEVFSAIQVIKLNAWETKFLERIQSWRVQELRAVAKYLYTSALSVVLLWTTPLLVSLTSFATYALVLGNELTAAKVFTAMVLFNAIRDPLSQFPGAVQSVLQARSSVDRVATFLSTNDVDTARVARDVGKYDDDVEIVVDKATFSWSGPSGEDASKAVLRDASLKIRKGDFVVVHGAVGSGKSSLCEALLGELAVTTGDVFVRSRSIAYYSQQPWIQNMSIRDNILFGLPYDKTKYDRVIDACGLVKDIAMFPARDATEIGQKGVNLSGGQKARVSLARACYADADVYVLDSPLAAVDAVVQSEIFNKCLCGLLENKTIVLVTHLEDVIHSPVANVKVHVENGSVDVSYGERSSASRRVYATPKTDVEMAEDPEAVVDGSFVETEGRQGGLVSGHVFKDYVQALGGTQVIGVFVLVLAAWQTFQISSDFWLSHWTGTREASQPDGSSSSVAYNLTVYAVLGLGTSVFVLLRAMVVAFVGTAAARRLFDDMTKSLLHAPLRFFDTNPIGRILNRYAEDVSMIDFRLPPVFFGAFVVSATNAFQLLAAVYVIRWAGILILPLGYVYIRLGGFYFTANLEVSRLRKVTTSPVLTHISQCEDGVVTLRAFGPAYVARAMQEHFRRVDDNNQAWYAQTVISQWFALRVQLVGVGVVVIIVSSLLALHDYLSPGLIGLAFMYAMNVDQQLALGLKSWLWLEMYLVSPERVLEYIGIPPEGHASDRLIVTSGSTHDEWPQRGTITFEDVKFAHKPGDDLVLKGLSFEICHNEKIGIVGRTGAGKSSLTMAIFRINELVSGRIMIDGVDISTVNLQTLRSRMSIIPQVPVLFKGPLRAYMDPFEEYDDAAIWLAFEKVALKDMVSALAGMLQHELSDNGENFSVGERQMLCMARALLRKSRVVVMDEATASIDVKTEQKLQRMIQREFVDATVLTIAHRLSTVLDSDRIMVLSDGRVVEFDSPHALAQVEGGVFRELAKESGNLAQLL